MEYFQTRGQTSNEYQSLFRHIQSLSRLHRTSGSASHPLPLPAYPQMPLAPVFFAPRHSAVWLFPLPAPAASQAVPVIETDGNPDGNDGYLDDNVCIHSKPQYC